MFIWCLVLIVMATMAAANVAQEATADSDLGSSTNQAADNANSLKVAATPDTAQTQVDAGDNPATDVSEDMTLRSIIFNKGASIKDALKFLAAKYHKNIVPSSKVDGAINVTNIDDVLTLHNVTFEEAMEAILGYSFKYDQDGDFVRVYTTEEYKTVKEDKTRMTYKVFTLYYLTAAEAKKLVTPVLSSSSKIESTTAAATGVPVGQSITTASGAGDAMALNDAIVVLDYPENIAKAEKLLKELDVRPKQVLIEATILSATLNEETALGIDWSTLKGVTIGTIANIGTGATDGAATSGFAYGLQTTHLTGGFSAGITSDHVAVLIRALEEVTDVTVLANPKILAVNKQLGQVYIGKKWGYYSQTTVSAEGGTSTSQVSFLETGTKLSFRPYIGNDGYIRMDIHPKDSDGKVASGLPEETSTEVVTNIMVKDGQTIVIGGLFRDSVSTTRNQIPLLGDLPIIGAVFRGTVDKAKREEVIVMLTPHIIEEPKETEGIARAEDINRKRSAAKNELQWIGRTRLAEDRYASATEYYQAGNKNKAMKELNAALTLRPTYLEAIRLKERIIGETKPDGTANLERNIRSTVEQKDSENWIRR